MDEGRGQGGKGICTLGRLGLRVEAPAEAQTRLGTSTLLLETPFHQHPLMELAPLAVSSLIALLAYGSQILFLRIEPYALRRSETYIFNVLLGCLWVCYARACLVNPGSVPAGWRPSSDGQDKHNSSLNEDVVLRSKWCRKCEAFKPPRAHHCKKCQR